MALLLDKSELQCRAYLVAALCLHDAVLFRHDTGCTQGGEHGLQGKGGCVILLREMAQGKLFAAALDQFQKLCGAFIVGKRVKLVLGVWLVWKIEGVSFLEAVVSCCVGMRHMFRAHCY